MRYMLMIYNNPQMWDSWTPDDLARIARAHKSLYAELEASGELVGTQALTTEGARIVRTVGGAPVVSDGPFTEAKEVLAGYYLVDVDSVERATEIAAKLPETSQSLVEIRSFMPDDFMDDWDQG